MALPVLLLATLLPSCKQTSEKGREARKCDMMVLHPTSRKLSSTYSATIRGKQDIDIRPKVSGYLTDVKVREGSVVGKGGTTVEATNTNADDFDAFIHSADYAG